MIGALALLGLGGVVWVVMGDILTGLVRHGCCGGCCCGVSIGWGGCGCGGASVGVGLSGGGGGWVGWWLWWLWTIRHLG